MSKAHKLWVFRMFVSKRRLQLSLGQTTVSVGSSCLCAKRLAGIDQTSGAQKADVD